MSALNPCVSSAVHRNSSMRNGSTDERMKGWSGYNENVNTHSEKRKDKWKQCHSKHVKRSGVVESKKYRGNVVKRLGQM